MLASDPGLREIAHGTWEGLLAAEIRARDPDRLVAWRDAPHEVLMPEGASLQHVFDRAWPALARAVEGLGVADRSEAHTSELQSLMRISYAVFCLKTNTKTKQTSGRTTARHHET